VKPYFGPVLKFGTRLLTNQSGLASLPQRDALEYWLQLLPSHHQIHYQQIFQQAPELELKRVGEKAIATVFDLLGYCHHSFKKKGFSDNPIIWINVFDSQEKQFIRYYYNPYCYDPTTSNYETSITIKNQPHGY